MLLFTEYKLKILTSIGSTPSPLVVERTVESTEGEAGEDKEVSEDADDTASHSGSLPSPGYVSISRLREVPAAFLVGLGELDGLGDHL